MNIGSFIPLILVVLLTYGLVQMAKRNKTRSKLRISRKMVFYIPVGYLLVLIISTAILYLVPVNEDSKLQTVEQSFIDMYNDNYLLLHEGKLDAVNPAFIIRQWHQGVTNQKLLVKPRTLGKMPVLIVIERIPGYSDTIDSFLFEGKLVMGDYEVKGYNDDVVISPKANELTIWNKGDRSYKMAYFQYDMIMTQFTSGTSYDNSHSTEEWLPTLYLKIPESIEVTIDEGIKEQVTEL
ncbi:hypothetical protein [Paenisporosarcina indica]|uniref:hypothetical protein n=1 Tax=Paenisporosarcina indica TaxID=650093 RepID=UPI00094F7005|nr:hypothetical protein [Paenisporosarcina indica]